MAAFTLFIRDEGCDGEVGKDRQDGESGKVRADGMGRWVLEVERG